MSLGGKLQRIHLSSLFHDLISPGSRRAPCVRRAPRVTPAILAAGAAILLVALAAPRTVLAQPGNDTNLPCGMLPFDSLGSCLSSGPSPGDEGPYEEQAEGDSVVYGPMDPPPWTPGVFDALTRTETTLPIPSGYIDWDPGYHAQAPGSRGCAPDPCFMGPGFEAVIGDDTRAQITRTTSYPWRTIGLIRVKWDNGKWYQGTGALVGPQHVLTCAHNLHDKNEAGATDKWAVEFEFYAGQTAMTEPNPAGGVRANRNARPYGKAGWKKVYYWTTWLTTKDRDFDMMLVVLDKPIGDTVGWMGRETGGTDVDGWRQLSGYPGDKPAFEQWWAGGTVSAETKYQIRYPNDTFGGHSGSPVWYYNGTADSRYIRAVHIGDRTATAENPNRGVVLNRGKYDTIVSWIADSPVTKAGVDCADCGPDCNENGIGDASDIANNTSQDANGDTIPDECQPDVVAPPDQISCVGPSPGTVPPNTTATITVLVSRASVPLANRFVSFHSPTGNVKFLNGILGAGGMTSLATTDAAGMVTMQFQPTAAGPGTIRAQSSGGTPFSDCFFNGTPVPVVVENLYAAADGDRVRLDWRLAAAHVGALTSVGVDRSDVGVGGPYVQRAVLRAAPEMQFTDEETQLGNTYHYRLVLHGAQGEVSFTGPVEIEVRDASQLRTTLQIPVDRGDAGIEIRYTLGGREAGVASLELFDVGGRRVRSLEQGAQAPGTYVRLWDRRDDAGVRLARGVYIVRLRDGTARELTRKLALVRK